MVLLLCFFTTAPSRMKRIRSRAIPRGRSGPLCCDYRVEVAGRRRTRNKWQLDSVAASSQSLGSSSGTVGFSSPAPAASVSLQQPGLRVHKLNFLPEAAGQLCCGENCPAAFSICQVAHKTDLVGLFVSTCGMVHIDFAKVGLLISEPDISPSGHAPQQSRLAPAWRLCFLSDRCRLPRGSRSRTLRWG
jgi:hypothetical protein